MSGIGTVVGRKICGGHYLIGGRQSVAFLTMSKGKGGEGEKEVVVVVSADVATAG